MRTHTSMLTIVLTLALSSGLMAEERLTTNGVEFGLNSYLGNLGNTEIRGSLVKPSATDRTNYLDAAQALGVKAIRETFLNWADVEKVEGGDYNLDPFDDLAMKASERGIEIIALAYPFPNWATGAVDEAPEKPFRLMYELPGNEFESEFRRVVATFAKRYSGQHPDSIPLEVPIRRWIFSNELDAFDITPDEYAYWLRVFTEEIKKVDPGATIATMGFRYFATNRKYFDEFLDSSNLDGPGFPYFDVVAFHVYPFDYDPNLYVVNANEGYIQRSLSKHNLSPPLWLMETGDRSTDEAVQASNVIKYMIHAGSVAGITRVHMHGLWDIMENHGWGVLAHAPSGSVPRKKASFRAVQTFLERVGNNRGVHFLGPGQYRVEKSDGTDVFVFWAEEENQNLNGLFCDEQQILVTDLRGASRRIHPDEMRFGAEPVFIELSD